MPNFLGGVDYDSASNSTLTFDQGAVNGSSSCTGTVIFDDLVYEKNENFSLNIDMEMLADNVVLADSADVPVEIVDNEGEW